jgi:hypothetical protein
VAQISRNTSHVGNIIQSQLSNELVHLQQKGQRLANAAPSTQHRDL